MTQKAANQEGRVIVPQRAYTPPAYVKRRVVTIVSRGQFDIDLLLECGHVVMHAISRYTRKTLAERTPKMKCCPKCLEQLRSAAAKELRQ